MDRRKFLQGSVAAGLAASSASSLAANKATFKPISRVKLKKNIVMISMDMGIFEKNYRENHDDCYYFQKHFQDFRKSKQVTYFGELETPDTLAGHDGAGNSFSCINFADRHKFPKRPFISFDHFLAENSIQETRNKLIYYGPAGHGGRSCLSWDRNIKKYPAVNGIVKLQDKLFGQMDRKEAMAAFEKREEILVRLYKNAKRAGGTNQAKTNLLESLEYRIDEIDVERKWIQKSKPKVAARFHKEALNHPLQHIDDHYDMIFNALEKNQSKIYTIGFNGGSIANGLSGLNHGYHTLTHHSYYPERTFELGLIDSAVLGGLSRFLGKLEENKMLDDTIVLFRSSMSCSSAHSNRNGAAFLFGGGFKHQPKILCKQEGILPRDMFASIAKQMGIPNAKFSGDSKIINKLF